MWQGFRSARESLVSMTKHVMPCPGATDPKTFLIEVLLIVLTPLIIDNSRTISLLYIHVPPSCVVLGLYRWYHNVAASPCNKMYKMQYPKVNVYKNCSLLLQASFVIVSRDTHKNIVGLDQLSYILLSS